MRHDNAANHPRGNTPAGGVRKLLAAVLILIFDTRCFGKTGAQIMRRTGLQRFAVLHHRFDAVCCNGAREAFILWLFAGHNGHSQWALCKGTIHFKRAHGFLHRIRTIGVGGMSFLP